MSDSDTLPDGVHPEVALLPWYANGTLGAQERQQVARHLESCPDCQRELDKLTQIQSTLAGVYGAQPQPSLRIAQSVLTRVTQEASARRTSAKRTGHWLDSLDEWFRSLFLARWVPTLAAAVLIAQLGLLLWLTMQQIPSDQITTRSLSNPKVAFKVMFQEQATEGQIRSLLNSVRGRVVDGPSADHTYVVEVIAGDPAVRVKTLEALRERTDLVHRAEPIAP